MVDPKLGRFSLGNRDCGGRRPLVGRRADLGHRAAPGPALGDLLLAGVGGGDRRRAADLLDAVRRRRSTATSGCGPVLGWLDLPAERTAVAAHALLERRRQRGAPVWTGQPATSWRRSSASMAGWGSCSRASSSAASPTRSTCSWSRTTAWRRRPPRRRSTSRTTSTSKASRSPAARRCCSCVRRRSASRASGASSAVRIPRSRCGVASRRRERWHFRDNPRIPPLLVAADEGWNCARGTSPAAREGGGEPLSPPLGMHGYDPRLPSMHGILIGRGPGLASKTARRRDREHPSLRADVPAARDRAGAERRAKPSAVKRAPVALAGRPADGSGRRHRHALTILATGY